MKPIKKTKTYLDPAPLCAVAKLAMKRGTALVFDKDGMVYGTLPKSSGSVNVIYNFNREWVQTVLAAFPRGAVFPGGNVFGGSATAKSLRPYANVRLPEDGSGQAWIDGVTNVLHVKGLGTTIHSSAFESYEGIAPKTDDESLGEFKSEVVADIEKMLASFTSRQDNRPALKRVYAFEHKGNRYIGSTDGKSAILQTANWLPPGFSYDPSVVALGDIVGYANEETETGAVIHKYRLVEGTTYIEKIMPEQVPELPRMFDSCQAQDLVPLMTSAAAAKLNEDIASLGLGVNDAFGGVAVFSSAGVALLSCNEPVAEFDCATGLSEGEACRFAVPVIARFARLGGDVNVAIGGNGVAIVKNGDTRIVCAPIVTPKKAEEANDAAG